MCSSSTATSPVFAFRVGPLTLLGNPRQNVQLATSLRPLGDQTWISPLYRGIGSLPATQPARPYHNAG